MASLRNAVPRKTHKERAAPEARKHLGLLEKKKDYIERARDYQRKVKTIVDLKKKAAERNPDEFYFGMLRSKTDRGVHEEKRRTGNETLSHAEICLLKDQDLTYLRMKQKQDEMKAERLQRDLHFLQDKPMNKHTVFLESEAAAASFDPAVHFDTDPKIVGRAYNRPRKSAVTAEKGGVDGGVLAAPALIVGPRNMKALKKTMKQRDKSYRELAERLNRAEKLKRLAARKEVERQVMNSKGHKRKVKDAENGKPAVYKWKRQRAK